MMYIIKDSTAVSWAAAVIHICVRNVLAKQACCRLDSRW